MFFFDPPVKKLKFGLPSRGLVSLIVPGWDYATDSTAQTLLDRSGNGNNLIRGATTSVGADDPTLSASGVTFGADDFCKSASAVFDDMAAFTVVTAFNAASYGGGDTGRFWGKARRELMFNFQKLKYAEVKSTTTGVWASTSTISLGVATITGLSYAANGTPSFYIGGQKNATITAIPPKGNEMSDAASDLIVGNRSQADCFFDGIIYAQAWYNRILSDSEYRQAYKGMQKLCLAMGVTI